MFPPSVCSMLELQLAVLLGKFLDSLPPQLDETMFHSFFLCMISLLVTYLMHQGSEFLKKDVIQSFIDY